MTPGSPDPPDPPGPSGSSAPPAGSPGRAATALRWSGGVVIAAVAITRCVIFFAPHLVFDLDPLVDATPLNGLGPAGSLALDAVLLLGCAAALAGEALARRRLEWALLVAAALPVPIVLWHGAIDAGDLWRGATWMSAVMAAVALVHLARDRSLRYALAAVLLAVMGPLLVRGAANMTYEYADSIRTFETHRAEILAGNGWEEGSAQARIFERRLRHRQPAAWFVTTNIYASLMAFALVAAVGLAIGAARAGMASGWPGLLVLLAAAAGVAVWATGSKGAVLTSAAGVVLVAAPFVHRRVAGLLRRYGGIVVVLCVLGALGGVVVRGAVLPESFAGDRSLLFRWHYMQASAAIVREHPALGVGPGGYQAAYVAHRVARNPEEVASAHSVFWDWLATLGVGAVSWIIAVLVMLRRAGSAMGRADDEPDETVHTAGGLGPGRVATIAVAVLVGLGFGVWTECAGLDALAGLVRGLGVALAVVVGLAVAAIMTRADRGIVAWSLAAAAVALVVHAQIEMTMTQPAAAVWCLCAVGLSGWRPAAAPRRGDTWLGTGFALALAVCAGWLVVAGVVPAVRAQGMMAAAARAVGMAAEGGGPAVEVQARNEAARLLVEAHEAMPTDEYPLVMAAEQLERAAVIAAPSERVGLLREALTLAGRAIDRGGRGRAQVIAISVHRRLAELTGEAPELAAAVSIARDMVDADPNGLGARRRLADLLWEAGRRDEARVQYRRTLEIDDAFGLDPLKQLPERARVEVERRAQ